MSPDSTSAPQFLTVAEVADIVRVSRMTVYRMVHAGELPAVRVGNSYRVPKDSVDELLSKTTFDLGERRA